MNKRIVLFFLFLIGIGLISLIGYYYVMHSGVRHLEDEKTNFTVTSASITSEFTTNIEMANKKYLEKAVAIKGKITDINGNEVILDERIICSMKNLDTSIMNNQIITIKGRIIGYDDLMGELKLDQCFVIKKIN